MGDKMLQEYIFLIIIVDDFRMPSHYIEITLSFSETHAFVIETNQKINKNKNKKKRVWKWDMDGFILIYIHVH